MDILQTIELDSARARISGHLQNFRTTSVEDVFGSVMHQHLCMKVVIQNAPLNGLDIHEILIRSYTSRWDSQALNKVTLKFRVSSYEATQGVQGLLLLMGEAINSNQPLNENTRLAIMQQEGGFTNRDKKIDVEIYIDRMLSCSDVPPAFQNTPAANLISPGAWQMLANVFQKLVIDPDFGISPVRSSHFNPAGPTVFGTLTINVSWY